MVFDSTFGQGWQKTKPQQVYNTETCLCEGANPNDAPKYERREIRFVQMENLVPMVEELMKALQNLWY